MISITREPTLKDVLADPLIHAVMAADRINPAELETSLNAIARRIERRRNIDTPGMGIVTIR